MSEQTNSGTDVSSKLLNISSVMSDGYLYLKVLFPLRQWETEDTEEAKQLLDILDKFERLVVHLAYK